MEKEDGGRKTKKKPGKPKPDGLKRQSIKKKKKLQVKKKKKSSKA